MKRFALFIALSALVLIVTAACAPATVLNAITPSSSYVLDKNISFNQHQRLTLDVYHAKDPKPAAPVLLFSHGGGWRSGDKKIYKFLGDSFTSAGYTVIVPNYRLHPNIRFPDMITDTAKSIAWTVANFDGSPIILIGHSAGGYNVLMNGLASKYLSAEGIDGCQHVAGVISIAAPVGISPAKKDPTITIFPDRFTQNDAPLNVASEPSPPILLIHGANDKTVYPENSRQMAEKILSRGGNAKYIEYAEMDHVEPIKVLSRYFEKGSSLQSDLLAFIERNSEASANYCQ